METLKIQLQQQIQQLPWQTHTISLLLDGVNINNLLHRFYTQQNTSPFEVLYLQTPLAQLYEISPCLIKIDNPNNPHLQDYLNNLQNEWGYILVSDQDWQQQIDHLRNLITVKLPHTQEQIILKIADPLVAKALFGLAEQQQTADFFGPFTQVYTTDIIDQQLNHYQRVSATVPPLKLPYQLTQEQNNQLDQVEIKRSNRQIYLHMQQHFPDFLAHYPTQAKREAIDHIITEAENKGYTSIMEQAYYLNIHGYLGEDALQVYPQLAKKIATSTLQSLKEAAQLAEQIAKL